MGLPKSTIFSSFAYLNPNFLLKKQQHEAKRTTRSSGGGDLATSLPNTHAPRKRRNEVLQNPSLSFPKAGLIRQALNLSASNNQGTSHSSSGDLIGTQFPAFKVAHGLEMSVLLVNSL